MKRHCLVAVLMLLSPSAYAGNSISFTVGGHRVYIEASPHCRSTSCASVSISGISRSHGRYDDDDRYEDDRVDNAQVKPQPAPPALAPPASRPPAVASPPAVYRPAAVATRIVAAPPPPPMAPTPLAVPPAPPPPPVLPPVAKPAEAGRPAPQVSRVSHDAEEDADTPIGDWRTEGKGSVRIARCGNALCGYVLDAFSNERGEAVLINMKRKNNSETSRQWTGSVYSQSSGDTYYGTMDIKGANTLRVEACALGRFYCSGNNWSRIVDRAESLMSSRHTLAEPRS
jgi:hypothetical protein